MIKRRKENGKGSEPGKSIQTVLTSNLWVGEGIKRTMSKSIFNPVY
jgi:hypothetical protein